MSMTEEQIAELVEFGRRTDVLVTPTAYHGIEGVGIRKIWFTDFVRAALYLQYLERTELPESRAGLVA